MGTRYDMDMAYEEKKKRSSLVTGLIVGLVLAIIIIVILIVVLALKLAKDANNDDLLGNEIHVSEAGRMLRSMNVSVDPCDDFYHYACGGYVYDYRNLPDDLSRRDIFVALNEELTYTLHDLLSAEIEPDDIESVQKAKTFFKSCMDEDTINGLGGQPLLDTLEEFGTWPVLNPNWQEASVDINDLMANLILKGQKSMANPLVTYDFTNASFNTMFMSQPEVTFRDFLLGTSDAAVTFTDAYHTLGMNLAKQLGGSSADASRIESQMNEMFAFETALAGITMSAQEQADLSATYNPMTLSEIISAYPQVWDWQVYLTTLMGEANVAITMDSRIIVRTPGFFENVNALIETVSTKTLVNYLLWNMVFSLSTKLPTEYTELYAPLSLLATGTSGAEDRWKTCVTNTNTYFANAVGRMYIVDHFPEVAKEDTLAMVSDLKTALRGIIETAEWMDDTTRSSALEKLEKMRAAVGYPDYILNDDELNAEYAAVTVNEGTFFQNCISATEAIKTYQLSTYSQPVDPSRWIKKPATVEAVYSPSENRMILVAGILQRHFYNNVFPKYMNYGAIGAVVGHEMTHGFDSTGENGKSGSGFESPAPDARRTFDGDGNLRDWWSAETLANYLERTQCLVDQYSEYRFEEVSQNVNGQMTLKENIADNGGVKEAYMAYHDWLEAHGNEDAKVPGLEHMSYDQLFFLSWGQVWCDSIRPSQLISSLSTSVHTPNQYRVIGTMQNSVEFSTAYNCPSGSYMNPSDKCEVW